MTDLKTNKMLISVILDRSGSMRDIRQQTIDGYNEYLNSLRKDTAHAYAITLIQFDTDGAQAGPALTITYEDQPLEKAADLTLETYQPRGMTPLYDAIGECVRRTKSGSDRAVTVVVLTDGMENASKEFDLPAIKKLITEHEALGWQFVFLGAGIDSYAVAGAMGAAVGNTANYAKANMSAVYGVMARSTIQRSALVSDHGLRAASAKSFFSDAQKVAIVAPDPANSTTGGSQAVQGGFPTTPVAGQPRARRAKRDWSVEKPDVPVAGAGSGDNR